MLLEEELMAFLELPLWASPSGTKSEAVSQPTYLLLQLQLGKHGVI